MIENNELSSIEQRLQVEARRLLDDRSGGAHLAAASQTLWSEYRRRIRRGRMAKAGGATLVLILAVVSISVVQSRVADVPPMPGKQRPSLLANRNQQLPAPTRRQVDRQRGAAARQSPTDEKSITVIPFVIGDATKGEDVISGFYVPEQIEPIDALRLSPGEREAVREVLGMESDTVDRPTI